MCLGGLVRQRLLNGFSYQWYCQLFGLVLFIYACVRTNNFYEFGKLLILFEALIIGSYLNTLKYIFIGLALGITVSSGLIVFGLSGGLFININTLAEIAVIILVGTYIYKLWWFIPGLLPSIFLNGSRGAVLTLTILAAVQFRWLWLFIIPFGIILVYWRPQTIYERLNIWRHTIDHWSWFGQGIGSFQPYSYYNLYTRPTNAHNDLLQILFELGVIGVILVIVFVILLLKINKDEKWILVTFLIIGCFDFPLYLPVSSCIAAMVCGFLIRDRNNIFRHDFKCRNKLL